MTMLAGFIAAQSTHIYPRCQLLSSSDRCAICTIYWHYTESFGPFRVFRYHPLQGITLSSHPSKVHLCLHVSSHGSADFALHDHSLNHTQELRGKILFAALLLFAIYVPSHPEF